MTYFDAHNHFHDARLAGHRDAVLEEVERLPLGGAVVNGTREEDWAAVAIVAERYSWALASYGLHPWYVANRSPDWLARLRDLVVADPQAGIGEIGLDRWIEDHDLPDQTRVFRDQLALATELNRPATIHCVQAWGALWDVLRETPVPACGFLIHAYGGPGEMIDGFVQRGAYFSFSPYFLHERKAAQRDAFRRIPSDRLLIETDAPDLRPPDELNPRPITSPDGAIVNHPANIDVAYAGLARVREMDVDSLAEMVAANYRRLFVKG